jgi:uncharacterized damage-inducible protein DinB
MFRTIEDFVQDWTFESQCTQRQMDQLTDQALGQAVSDGHRTLGRLAWHITTAMPWMMQRTGLSVDAVSPSAPVPKTAAEIGKAYAAVSKQVLDQLTANWNDGALQVEDQFPGMTWKRGVTLFFMVKHEVHHRGQMTVLMRQAGLKVPGVYGPSKEDWADRGAPVPEV